MSDAIFKIRVLLRELKNTVTGWKDGLWDLDLDTSCCCDGKDCLCAGITHREDLKRYLEQSK